MSASDVIIPLLLLHDVADHPHCKGNVVLLGASLTRDLHQRIAATFRNQLVGPNASLPWRASFLELFELPIVLPVIDLLQRVLGDSRMRLSRLSKNIAGSRRSERYLLPLNKLAQSPEVVNATIQVGRFRVNVLGDSRVVIVRILHYLLLEVGPRQHVQLRSLGDARAGMLAPS